VLNAVSGLILPCLFVQKDTVVGCHLRPGATRQPRSARDTERNGRHCLHHQASNGKLSSAPTSPPVAGFFGLGNADRVLGNDTSRQLSHNPSSSRLPSQGLGRRAGKNLKEVVGFAKGKYGLVALAFPALYLPLLLPQEGLPDRRSRAANWFRPQRTATSPSSATLAIVM
jgi:hypothetical protein